MHPHLSGRAHKISQVFLFIKSVKIKWPKVMLNLKIFISLNNEIRQILQGVSNKTTFSTTISGTKGFLSETPCIYIC